MLGGLDLRLMKASQEYLDQCLGCGKRFGINCRTFGQLAACPRTTLPKTPC